jgi:mono/diheme cytochrome c family protein/plastocyanin
LSSEHLARFALALVVIAVPLTLAAAWWAARSSPSAVTIHGRVSEDGGWLPGTVRATAGSPLHLRLVSDDVVHGFAIGRNDEAPLDLPPGQVVETTLTFDQPGTYTFYCTRWCGPNHWRMRGVIEVSGGGPAVAEVQDPLYETLGIDIDAPHPASVVPDTPPSAQRGEALGIDLPEGSRTREDFLRRSPDEIWQVLRRDPSMMGLSDSQVWDLVAYLWRSTTTDEALREGQALYAQNCAACHGESGTGEGVMAGAVPATSATHLAGQQPPSPANFTDPSTMLGASSALLQGKILRGGMGTGMPYWGPILTEAQMWALADYLWTSQFGALP